MFFPIAVFSAILILMLIKLYFCDPIYAQDFTTVIKNDLISYYSPSRVIFQSDFDNLLISAQRSGEASIFEIFSSIKVVGNSGLDNEKKVGAFNLLLQFVQKQKY